MNNELPMQPVYKDEHGVIRFRENKVVRYMLDQGNIDMNHLYRVFSMDWEKNRKDMEQFAQLIGYSINGYADLSYVSDEAYSKAQEQYNLLDQENGVTQ